MIVIETPTIYTTLGTECGRVVTAAPDMQHMVGKTVTEVLTYCRRKHWRAETDDKADELRL